MAKKNAGEVAIKLEERALKHRKRALLAEDRNLAYLQHALRRAAENCWAAEDFLSKQQADTLADLIRNARTLTEGAIRNGARKAAGLPVEAPAPSGDSTSTMFDQERPL